MRAVMTRILLVEPNRERRRHLRDVLASGNFQIIEAADLIGATANERGAIDIAIANAELGGNRGILLKTVLEAHTPLVLYAEHGSVRCAVEAMQQGAADYLVMPMEPTELLAALKRCLHGTRQPIDDESLVRTGPIIGHCDAILALRERIGEVARSGAMVLIRGEAGVGKELVARTIHAQSPWAHRPLISMSCASSSPASIETELFGNQATPSGITPLVEAAHGGTLFLDEIGELSASAQRRLYDIVRRREYQPSSAASRARPIDLLLIATSYVALEPSVESGRFHAGLHASFAAATLHVPPLRDRGEDVVELAHWLLPYICRRLSKPEYVLSDAALDAIRTYSWPGNVRELHNALERAVILCEGTVIQPSLLAIGARSGHSQPASGVGHTDADEGETSLEGYFVKFVLEHQDELTETELAAKLGISRKSLWERRHRLNIPRRRTRRRGTRHDVEH
jgi:two-component system, NtrC family, response regulator HydG